MSIFSGFATRKQEQKYDGYLVSVICLLQQKIFQLLSLSKCLKEELDSYKFSLKESVKRVASHIREMERSKYLPPKISPLLFGFCSGLEAEEPTIICRTLESSAKSSNVRIKVKNPRAVSRDTTQRKKIYESLKENSPEHADNLEKFDMEQLLKNRPALPRRVTLPNKKKRPTQMVNLYEIQEFQEDDINIRPSFEEDDSSSSNTPHTFKSIKAIHSRQSEF